LYRKPPVLAMEDLGLQLGEVRGDPIEQLARYGARLVLMSYLEAEVSELIGADRYERAEERRGHRNGRRRRKVTCGMGEIEIDFPKVRDTERPFRSSILEAWQRTSDTLMKTLPSLYVEGLSTRDVERALKPLHDGAGLSRSTVSRANEQIKEAFDAWRRRDLSKEKVIYLFLDGHFEGVRLGTREKEAILVAHGITESGGRTLLGVYLGGRESTEAWKLALEDLVERKLAQPLLVISDGNAGADPGGEGPLADGGASAVHRASDPQRAVARSEEGPWAVASRDEPDLLRGESGRSAGGVAPVCRDVGQGVSQRGGDAGARPVGLPDVLSVSADALEAAEDVELSGAMFPGGEASDAGGGPIPGRTLGAEPGVVGAGRSVVRLARHGDRRAGGALDRGSGRLAARASDRGRRLRRVAGRLSESDMSPTQSYLKRIYTTFGT
jgi:hypothetical protein